MARITAKEKLTEAALELMLRQGYGNTTVDEVCLRAGVSKGSCYHFFDSKEELGLAALARYFKLGMEDLTAGAYMEIEDPFERAYGFVDHVAAIAEEHWQHGCLIGTFAMELAETNERLRKEAACYFGEIEQSLAETFAPFAATEGQRPNSLEIARHFTVVLEGAIVLSRAYGDLSLISEGLKPFRFYLDTLRAQVAV
ncbi:MAG: TetR/AcrR family transcriptional regulator [Candidatus Hydrogenedentes bacterium]|nr:TetR/AcrR family transcriptional regulator [Candidatus Hydrogenedentota bacterium]